MSDLGTRRLTAAQSVEADRIAAELGGGQAPGGQPEGTARNGRPATSGREVVAESFAGIRAERARWLWERRVPLGTATLLVGREKLGKSTLTAELAAQLSRGTLDGDLRGQPSATLIATFEDSAARTIKPRLMAAGADVERVHLITARRHESADLVSLPGDVERIGELAVETGARLVVVDPLSASLGADIDGHRDQDIRRALAPLVALAERCDLAVLCLAHLTKAQGGDALSRVLGSRGLTAAARSVLTFGRAPDADEDSPERVLAHPASNLAREAASLAYRHEGREVHADDGEVIETNRLVLLGECDVRADELIVTRSSEERTATDGAAEWLEDELADGEWHAGHEVKAKAKAADHSEKALRAARERLEIEYQRAGLATAGRGQSEWRVPLMPSPSQAEGMSAEGTSVETRIPEPKTADSGSAHALSQAEGTSGANGRLATASEEAERRDGERDAKPRTPAGRELLERAEVGTDDDTSRFIRSETSAQAAEMFPGSRDREPAAQHGELRRGAPEPMRPATAEEEADLERIEATFAPADGEEEALAPEVLDQLAAEDAEAGSRGLRAAACACEQPFVSEDADGEARCGYCGRVPR